MQCYKQTNISPRKAGSVMLFLVLLAVSTHEVYGGFIAVSDSELRIVCRNYTLETLPPANVTQHQKIIMHDCPPPRGSYADALRALRVDISEIHSLTIYHVNIIDLREDQLHGLPLRKLEFIDSYVFTYNFNSKHTVDNLDFSKPDILKIFCSKDILENRTLVYNRTVSTPYIHIFCPLPIVSYQAALKALNVDATTLSYLGLVLTPNPALRSSHLSGIQVKELHIITSKFGLNRIDRDIFQEMSPSLKIVDFDQVVMPTLPESSQIEYVHLKDGRSVGAWGGCSKLKKLKLEAWEVPALDQNTWLSDCPQLAELELEQMTRRSLERVVTGSKALTSLTIKDSFSFIFTDNWLTSATKLKKIRITGTPLDDPYSVSFPAQAELEELELTNVRLVDFEMYEVLEPLKSLRSLTLDKNIFVNFCTFRGSGVLPPTLKRVSMRNSMMIAFCFNTWNTLEFLDLSGNDYKRIMFTSLPIPGVAPIVVNLRNNSLQRFPKSEEEYDTIYQKYKKANNLTILMDNQISCDCENAWFARLLRSLPNVRVEHARCTSGELLEHVPPEQLECDKFPCADCTCRTSWHDNTTAADCTGVGLNAIPPIPNLRTLIMRQNNIETFDPKDFPETLLSVDLRDNHVAHMSAEVVAAMFSQPARRVWLAGKSLVCDCENQPLIEALQKYHIQVVDYANLTCVDSGTPVSDVVIESLCFVKLDNALLIPLTVSAGLLVLIILAAVIYYRYRSQIKVSLYIRGYCLCCIQEEELDLDRQYDAFVSFSHEDESFVFNELLPKLERNNAYKLCVHSRDWVPGELIPAQIVSSVQQSRRTVIVLSKNFVNSMWAMLEFRTAYTNALQEKRVRLVIIVLDDVIDDGNLEPELNNYLNINTYVKWSDRWFWEKLQYALPHRRAELKRRLSTRKRTEMINPHQSINDLFQLTVANKSNRKV